MSLTADVRAMLPDLDGYAYFQTSGFSPKLNPVVDETVRWLKFQSRGPALPFVTRRIEELKRDIRGKVARTVNATPEEIVMTENTTIGINIVANGIDWKPGDNVLLTTHEHPGNRLTWYNLTGRYDVELRFAPMYNDLGRTLEEMDRLIDGRTRLVSVSHVSRRTGLRLPGRAVCDLAHGKDTPVLFDGAQSFGAIPIDVRALDCDFYSFCGHKYTMAPQGTGGLFIRRDRIDWLKPSWIGSHSQKSFDQEGHMDLHDEARRFEFATRSVPDQAGFGKALEIWDRVRVGSGIYRYRGVHRPVEGRVAGNPGAGAGNAVVLRRRIGHRYFPRTRAGGGSPVGEPAAARESAGLPPRIRGGKHPRFDPRVQFGRGPGAADVGDPEGAARRIGHDEPGRDLTG